MRLAFFSYEVSPWAASAARSELIAARASASMTTPPDGAEIAAWISEHCFNLLDAPVMREASLDMAIPFADTLEQAFLPKARITEKLKELIEY